MAAGAHARGESAPAPPELTVLMFCKEFHLDPWYVWQHVPMEDVSYWAALNNLYNATYNAEKKRQNHA